MQDTNALINLTKAVENCFNVYTVPKVWLICGYAIATMRRKAVMEREGFFPQLNVFGDGTIAAKVGASLAEMHHDRDIIKQFNENTVYDQVSHLRGSVLLIDDPGISRIGGFIWDMANGITRIARGKDPQTPNTNCMFSTKCALADDTQSIASRLLKLRIPNGLVNKSALPALEKAMDEVAAFPGLHDIPYYWMDCEAIEDYFLGSAQLKGKDPRIATSFGLITYFTQEFCNLAGVDFEVMEYVAAEHPFHT